MTRDYHTATDDAAFFYLRREVWNVEVVARFTVDGEPVSKARARFTSYGSKTRTYTPAKTKTGEERVAWAFRKAAPDHQADDAWTYGVTALFFNGTLQRRDVDNMTKLILDGLNGVAWVDDNQVVEVSARKDYDYTVPRTEVVVYRVGAPFKFTKPCERCGAVFETFPSGKKRFCSKECANATRRTTGRPGRHIKPCDQCGQEFRSEKGQRYCSRECAWAARRVELTCDRCGTAFTKQRCYVRANNYCTPACRDDAQRERRRSTPKGTCQSCGGPVSKKTYTNCAACRNAGKKVSGRVLIGPDLRRDPVNGPHRVVVDVEEAT